jgi:hypothetical protein
VEVSQNRVSKKYFVYINAIEGTNKAEFVTPQGEIKALELRFFDELNDKDEGGLLSDGSLTELQVQQYHAYIENRKKDEEFRKKERREEVERIIRVFQEMFPGLKNFSPEEKILLVKRVKKLKWKRR